MDTYKRILLGIMIKHNMRNEIVKRLNKIGHLLSCGQNEVGQLGLGEDVTDKTRPALVVDCTKSKVVDISAGGMHSKQKRIFLLHDKSNNDILNFKPSDRG